MPEKAKAADYSEIKKFLLRPTKKVTVRENA
jgi:hypothetical protein